MISQTMLGFGRSKSCIRELAAYGARRKAEIGADRVFDYSLGNPSVPAPDCVNEAIRELLSLDSCTLHGYTTAAGLPSLRRAIAEDMRKRYAAELDPDKLYIICGAAAGLAICLRALVQPGEEVIAFAPFFPEYRMFTEGVGGVLVRPATVIPSTWSPTSPIGSWSMTAGKCPACCISTTTPFWTTATASPSPCPASGSATWL